MKYSDKTEYKLKDYYNTWSIIDQKTVNGVDYGLLENNTYGDETCYIVVDLATAKDKKYHKKSTDEDVILPTFDNIVCETFDDIETALIDEGILNESLAEVAPDIRSNVLSFPNGTYFYIDYENGKLFSGNAVGGSIVPEVSIDYDKDETFDANLNKLFDKMIEEDPELLDDEPLEEANDKSDKKLFKEFKIYVDDRFFEISHTERRKDEIVPILKQLYPDSEITVKPYNHYESGVARKSLERIIANQIQKYAEE